MDLKLAQEAARNLDMLAENPYPGRGLVVGLNDTGRYLVQAYFVTGRSKNSRNRLLAGDDGRIFTEAANPAEVEDSSLIFYNAMNEAHGVFVVGNGIQTDTALELKSRLGHVSLDHVFETMDVRYEPDAPNFTPRITAASGMLLRDNVFAEISVLKKSAVSNGCDHSYYSYDGLIPGFGYCVTTYMGDGNPLPAFRGEPYLLPFQGSSRNISTRIWAALHEGNRVSLAVKFIDLRTLSSDTCITNKYTKA